MIKICGCNSMNQLSKNSNNKDTQEENAIDPPLKLPIDPSLIKSFSICRNHSIIITHRDTIHGIGNNTYRVISASLPRQIFTDFTEFEIRNEDNLIMKPISAVCCFMFSLYMILPGQDKPPQLAMSHFNMYKNSPLFLNLNGRYPVSLYSGEFSYAAVIDNKNEVILISNFEIHFQGQKYHSYCLPFNEKAVSLAVGESKLFALSSSGKVYCSKLSSHLEFSSVVELNDNFTISYISGIRYTYYALTNDGRVFGLGEVKYGLPRDEVNGVDKFETFTEISSLKGVKIKGAFAGYDHSLFITEDGKVLACGNNRYGQLNINAGPTTEHSYLPVETRITQGCTYCIAGSLCSAFFINCNPPPFIPNKKIDIFKEEEQFSTQTKLESFETLKLHDIQSFSEKKLIGKGGQSHVYQVVKDDKIYALKEIDASISSMSIFELMSRIIHEYETIKKLDHPNIIKAFGIFFGNTKNPPSILLEFCPFNLFSSVKKLSNVQKITAVFEIVSAMIEVHKNKIIHRDLKPENILFDELMHVKISDFGIAKFYDATNSTKTTGIGSLKFMAPEILNESTNYSEKVDVYSFGVLLFFLLTDGKYPKINIAKIAAGEKAPIPKTINCFSNKLIMRCWSTNPDERPSFSEIADEIQRNNFILIDEIEDDVPTIKKFLSI